MDSQKEIQISSRPLTNQNQSNIFSPMKESQETHYLPNNETKINLGNSSPFLPTLNTPDRNGIEFNRFIYKNNLIETPVSTHRCFSPLISEASSKANDQKNSVGCQKNLMNEFYGSPFHPICVVSPYKNNLNYSEKENNKV